MRSVFTFVLFLSTFNLFAQYFGSEQTYLFEYSAGVEDGFGKYTTELSLDSIIDGAECYSYSNLFSKRQFEFYIIGYTLRNDSLFQRKRKLNTDSSIIDTSYFIFKLNCKIGDTLRIENSRNDYADSNYKYAYYIMKDYSLGRFEFEGFEIPWGLPWRFYWIDSLGADNGGVEFQEMNRGELRSLLTASCRDDNVVFSKQAKFLGNPCNADSIIYLYAAVSEQSLPVQKFTISPNPAIRKVNVNGLAEAQIEIITTVGETESYNHTGGETTIQCLNPGFYFIRIYTIDGSYETHRLVVY